MVVKQDKKLAHWQVRPTLEYLGVLDTTGNGSHIEDDLGIAQRISGSSRAVQIPQFSNLHAEFFRPGFQILPGESPFELRIELIPQRHGIMVIEQNEKLADRQFRPALENLGVLHSARDEPNIKNNLGIAQRVGDRGGGGGIHSLFFVM